MFLIKIPTSYDSPSKIEEPFKELSLAYRLENSEEGSVPVVHEGEKLHEGETAIFALIKELQDYYGEHYNCSCAR